MEIKIGQLFGRWTVISENGRDGEGKLRWGCRCDCGTEREVRNRDLVVGKSTSCGCLRRESASLTNTTHGLSRSKEYSSWQMMISRCCNPNYEDYARYGGIGITVCERWRSFANFYEDMGPRPRGATIERLDNDKGYYPENCAWDSRSAQARNRSSNVWVYVGSKRMLITDAAMLIGVNRQRLLIYRNKYGDTPQQAINRAIAMKGRLANASIE